MNPALRSVSPIRLLVPDSDPVLRSGNDLAQAYTTNLDPVELLPYKSKGGVCSIFPPHERRSPTDTCVDIGPKGQKGPKVESLNIYIYVDIYRLSEVRAKI